MKSNLRPMCSIDSGGYSHGRNKYGYFSFYDFPENHEQVIGFTQLFKSGEIWGIDTYYLEDRSNDDVKHIHINHIEKDLIYTLDNYIKAVKDYLKLPLPIKLQIGMTNIQDFQLVDFNRNRNGTYAGKVLVNVVEHDIEIKSYDISTSELLLPFLEKLYDEAGLIR